ncbi:uncharacterized protein LOC141909926 [Tubulanus polymorphus]|uniref:uncharacterized protein LOC141909926 n=1 Tax=Tubulanus polymorphus TaxID=672921 RepID=UPI003DA5F517
MHGLTKSLLHKGINYGLQQVRLISTNDVTRTKLNDWLEFTTPKDADESDKRPLAIIYKWLRARPKDVWKYEELYLDRGFDVLTTGIAVKELFHRPAVLQRNDAVIRTINSPLLKDRPILVHSFSVGGYVVTELRVRAREDPEMAANFSPRLMAHIYDSFIDYNGAYYGLSRTIFGHTKAASMLEASLNVLDKIVGKNPKSMAYAFKKTTEVFHSDPHRAPALLYFSGADLLGAPKWSEIAAHDWGKLGMTVHTKGWQDSAHVGHLRKHREEYVHTLDRFLAVLPQSDQLKIRKSPADEILRDSVDAEHKRAHGSVTSSPSAQPARVAALQESG